jgi:hypothetical protein
VSDEESWSIEAEARLGFTRNDLTKCFQSTMERLDSHTMSAHALMIEKERVRRELQRYDSNFIQLYNRLPSQQEKWPMKGLYRYYNHLKIRLGETMQQNRLFNSEKALLPPVVQKPRDLALPPGLFVSVRPPPGLSCQSVGSRSSRCQHDFIQHGSSEEPAIASSPRFCKQFLDCHDSDTLHSGSLKADHALEVATARIEWLVGDVSTKLYRGNNLASHDFEIDGQPDLRLIFVPGETFLGKKSMGKRLKSHVGKVPKFGALMLKCMTSEFSGSLRFDLFVSSSKQGRYECDFAEKSVQECLFSADWLEHFDNKADRLEVCLQFC